MSLLVDGGIVTLTELRVYDSSLLEVASIEQVDLTAKLDLVQRQAVEDMKRALERKVGPCFPVEQVVATESVRRWWAYRALEMIYRDVYFSQLNDRYGERWRNYEALAQESERALWLGGLGRNYMPLPRPDQPTVTIGAGTIPAGTYFVATSWVNSRGEQSTPSLPVTVCSDAQLGLSITAGAAPAAATGFVVYAGTDAGQLALQSGGPVAVGTAWTKAGGALDNGAAPGDGQGPDEIFIPNNRVKRG